MQNSPKDKLVVIIPPDIVSWFVRQNTKKDVDAILWIKEPRISYELAVEEREDYIKDFGIREYEQLLIKILWQSNVKLSFSDFKEFKLLRGNFFCHFWEASNFFYGFYLNRWYCKDFVEKNPKLNKKILNMYRSKLKGSYEESPKELALLYKAYELMLEDPSVSINHNLFS